MTDRATPDRTAAPAPLAERLLPHAGPWDCMMLNRRWAIYPKSAVNDGVDYFIAFTASVQDRAKEKANAIMLSAAPELLDALKRVWDAYGFDPSIDSSIWTDVQAAIAKAEGRT